MAVQFSRISVELPGHPSGGIHIGVSFMLLIGGGLLLLVLIGVVVAIVAVAAAGRGRDDER
jgi:hypothetical protein